jgi:hypothetical protein
MRNERNLTHQITNLRRQMHPDQLAGRQNSACTRTNNTSTRTARRHKHATHQHNAHTCVPRRGDAGAARKRGNWPRHWPALAPQNLRSMGCGQPGAMQGVCKGRAAAHLLLSDADVKLGAVRKQGVWRPPAAVLTACREHIRRSHAGPERPPQACVGSTGGGWFRASGGTWSSGPPRSPVGMTSGWTVLVGGLPS